MKRFLLFGGDTYYPSGGWDDFLGDFDTVEDANAELKRRAASIHVGKLDWTQIVNSETGEIIK